MIKFNRHKSTIEQAEVFPIDIEKGLTTEQVNKRIEAGLINKTKKYTSKSYLRIFYENVVNFFNLLLFAIAALMIIARVSIFSFVFMVILIANIAIGLYQDIRARRLIDKLKVLSAPKVNVLRDGKIVSITADKLVLSDIVELKLGSQIACDGSIVDGFIELNESLLTGESVNIAKNTGDPVYSGSFATSGTALYRVEQLGKNNYAEKLQIKAKKFKKIKSEILINIKRFLRVIGVFVIILGAAQFAIAGQDLIWPGIENMAGSAFQSFVTKTSGSLIAMIPIGMYLLTSVTLAVGVIRLARRKMLTQDMYCIEMLARADVLCLDKTGTLTDGNLVVEKVVSTSDVSERDIAKILYTLVDATKDDNATARAIREHFGGLNKFDAYSAIPFSSDRKYSAVMLEDGRSIVMGAREFIPHENPMIDDMCREYERNGKRVLILGVQHHVVSTNEPLQNCDIIGFTVLEDHIKDDAAENIAWFRNNGVSIRIITGDSPESASEIARRAGVEDYDKVVCLEGKTLEEVRHIARDYVVFGRVTPEQKEVIVAALKEDGHTVAMTGDGVNDILALRVADCSIAMASGSDAAKNVSHLVSLESNFASLPDVVKEGRRVINNLQRAISIFLVKTMFAIVLTSIFLIWKLVNPEIPAYPFIPNNLYIWEILFIGIGSLFLSLQPNDEQIKSKFIVNILCKVLPAAIVQILITVILFVIVFRTNPGIATADAVEIATALSTVCISVFSFIILVKVCLPFDIYRLFLVIGLGFIGTVGILADYFALGDGSVLGIRYSLITSKYTLVIVLTLLIAVAVYIGLEVITSKIHAYIDFKKEEEKYDHF